MSMHSLGLFLLFSACHHPRIVSQRSSNAHQPSGLFCPLQHADALLH
uniref:Lipoprotein n=1 Tax=Picea sitchensis TaxID=3332 RepID=A9NMV4_PICSI|nr:unknown [Picea sitchensis]